MQINLSEHQEEFINQQLDAGLYSSVDEMFQEILNNFMLLSDPEFKARVDAGIQSGLADIEAGRVMTPKECFGRIRANLDAKYASNG